MDIAELGGALGVGSQGARRFQVSGTKRIKPAKPFGEIILSFLLRYRRKETVLLSISAELKHHTFVNLEKIVIQVKQVRRFPRNIDQETGL